MIQKALQFTENVFNQFIKNKFELDDTIVITNKIVDGNGSVPLENKNKIVISLIHLEQETNKPFYSRTRKVSNTSYAMAPPQERYNLYLLITPNFDDYYEGLKFLNASIQFFQLNGVLDVTKSSKIPKEINKIEFQLENGDGYMQMQNLWTALGAKYQPSIIYKMKLIAIVNDEINGFDTAISQIYNESAIK